MRQLLEAVCVVLDYVHVDTLECEGYTRIDKKIRVSSTDVKFVYTKVSPRLYYPRSVAQEQARVRALRH